MAAALPKFSPTTNTYTRLKEGDILPSVGVLQKLLNRTGAKLKVDGRFGPVTNFAVQLFQDRHGLLADGIVDKRTWDRICWQINLPIFDYVDVFDESLHKSEVNDIRWSKKDYINIGGREFDKDKSLVMMGGASNGVVQAIHNIRMAIHEKLFLLRFHGHENDGVIGFSFGQGGDGKSIDYFNQYANIDYQNIDSLLPILMRLRSIFLRPYASVELHHCSVAKGVTGKRLISKLANIFNVPVTAGLNIQNPGYFDTFKFEGPTYTACPFGITLQEWCRRLPDFIGMSY